MNPSQSCLLQTFYPQISHGFEQELSKLNELCSSEEPAVELGQQTFSCCLLFICTHVTFRLHLAKSRLIPWFAQLCDVCCSPNRSRCRGGLGFGGCVCVCVEWLDAGVCQRVRYPELISGLLTASRIALDLTQLLWCLFFFVVFFVFF